MKIHKYIEYVITYLTYNKKSKKIIITTTLNIFRSNLYKTLLYTVSGIIINNYYD